MKFDCPPQIATDPTHFARIRNAAQREIGFIHNPEFERIQLHEALSPTALPHRSPVAPGPDDADELLTPTEEQHRFRRYNYLKYKANVLRSRLTDDDGSSALLHQIDELLRAAAEIRAQLVSANVRLVASIARRHSRNQHDFDELYAEASVVLLKAVEKFDYARGFRFSTYATHSIQRHLVRVLQRRQKLARRERSCDEQVAAIPDRDDSPVVDDEALRQFRRLWERSDEHLSRRDRFILTQRFGLNESQRSKTLKEIAADIGLSKERVRQIQLRALEKLREFAQHEGLAIEL